MRKGEGNCKGVYYTFLLKKADFRKFILLLFINNE